MKTRQLFEKYKDVYSGNFNLVENKRSERPDLHAFLLLAELDPNNKNCIVSDSDLTVIYLDVSQSIVDNLTDAQVLELARCGGGI